MAPHELFRDDPANTREAILRATYHTLQKYGYTGLSIGRIGEEIDLTKSTFYYHFEDKDDLLLSFSTFMLDLYLDEIVLDEDTDAAASLDALFSFVLLGEVTEELSESAAIVDPMFARTYIELRAQAAHDDAYREQFTESDRFLHDQLAGIVHRGIEQGVFREVDPDRTAELLLTILEGAILRRATTDNPAAEIVRAELDDYVRWQLLATND